MHIMPATDINIDFLIGETDGTISVQPLVPYDELICEFLSSLSSALLLDKEAKLYADVISFAYWCRRANIYKLKREFADTYNRLGLGLVLHIAPSNVPINFAFSYAFSILSGNANIVRVPTKDFPQTRVVCKIINQLFTNERYKTIADMTAFVRYSPNNELTGFFSGICNARIIWGGDQTINNIRKLKIPERSIEVVFADRYSMCVIDGNSVIYADNTTLNKLVRAFYNDTYLMDQNACSSPHLVVWFGENTVLSEAKRKFWDRVYEIAMSKYELQPVNAVDKYTLLCRNAIDLSNITDVKRHGNYVYRIALSNLPDNMDVLRGRYGYFYEYDTQDLNSIAHIINKKYQTLTYFGLEKAKLLEFVIRNRLLGIDRIVPVGSALDIGIIWDGYDVVRSLSRIIDVK